MPKRINKEDLSYIKKLSSELIDSLSSVVEEQKEDYYIYQSPHRAKFKRLRIELSQVLLQLEKQMYK